MITEKRSKHLRTTLEQNKIFFFSLRDLSKYAEGNFNTFQRVRYFRGIQKVFMKTEVYGSCKMSDICIKYPY